MSFRQGRVLQREYVVQLVRDGDQVTIETLTPWGIGTFQYTRAVSEIGEASHYRDAFNRQAKAAPGWLVFQMTNAPWVPLYAVGRRFPFVLDLQAETIETEAVSALTVGMSNGREKS